MRFVVGGLATGFLSVSDRPIMETQSYSAWLWLEWIALKGNKEIRHALNYSEAMLGKYKVDGFNADGFML
ncbi:MAG: hypothetical protein GY840_23635 [Pseudoalteromonas sp.]|nr:hypothetical protein [Pseudoalteromonas sp.]